jgi:hypothetical protein
MTTRGKVRASLRFTASRWGAAAIGFDFRYMVLVTCSWRPPHDLFPRQVDDAAIGLRELVAEMNRTVAFGLVGPVIIALLGAFVYVPIVIYLNGQSGVSADTYEVAFVLFLIMGLVPEWLNFIVIALGRTQLRSSIGAGLFGGAAMAFMPKLVGLPHENPIVCALMGMIASSICWWVAIRNPAKGLMEQA